MAFTPINIFTSYYNNKNSGNPGNNRAINGNYNNGHFNANVTHPSGYYEYEYHGNNRVKVWANVLPNCVGYAIGRYHQVLGDSAFKTFPYFGDAGTFFSNAKKRGLKTGSTPKPGAIICWALPGSYGHVAFVERVISDTEIIVSESGWGYTSKAYSPAITTKKGSGNWLHSSWMKNYKFQGFIYSPNDFAGSGGGGGGGGAWGDDNPTDYEVPDYYSGGPLSEVEVTTKKIQEKITVNGTKTAQYSGTLSRTKSTSLLTYPSLVESPFIIVNFGQYTFGSYTNRKVNNVVKVEYPNYITSMNVVKVNGSVNQYTINMSYQIRAGDDPNFIDKVLSSVGYNNIKISYGDWQSPTFIYKEEVALITKVTSNIDFANARITYVVNCVSNSVGLYASNVNFIERYDKPSNIIKEVFRNSSYGLQQVFTGMNEDNLNSLIASDDQAVRIYAKPATDPLSYINYLVTCMISNTNSKDSVILDSSYYMVIHDDKYGADLGGPYFTVEKILANSGTIHSYDVYEVDVGYPSENMVMEFNITNDNSWDLIYAYNDDQQRQDYSYYIDNQGRMMKEYSPEITTSGSKFITTASQKTWWTQMTQFPISATLTIKGLVRPAMLMQYIKVNAMFYGQRHMSSGLYFVKKQQDIVDSRGYRTVLTIQRFAGDDDYLTTYDMNVERTVTEIKPAATSKTTQTTPSYRFETSRKTSDSSIVNAEGKYVDQLTDNQLSTMYHRGDSKVSYEYPWIAYAGTTYYIEKQQRTFIARGKLTEDYEAAEAPRKTPPAYTRIKHEGANWYVKTDDLVNTSSTYGNNGNTLYQYK